MIKEAETNNHDNWLDQSAPSDLAPNLVLLVSKRVRARLTVRQGLLDRHWTRAISGSMSSAAIAEFLDLWEATADIALGEEADRTIWRWTSDGKYSAKSAYKMLHTGALPFRGHALIWKTWAPLKVKIFLWLSFMRRHWTNDRRARHSLKIRQECFLCDQEPETIDHILCRCSYTREVWYHICQALGKALPAAANSVLCWWKRLRQGWQGDQQKGFDSIFALTSWAIWKERNARCFRDSATAVQDLLRTIQAETDLWAQAGAKHIWSLRPGGVVPALREFQCCFSVPAGQRRLFVFLFRSLVMVCELLFSLMQ